MKKTLKLIVLLFLGLMVGCQYDDSEIIKRLDDLQEQIDTQQKLLDAMANQLTIVSVIATEEGYVITFSDNTTITVKECENLFESVTQDKDSVTFVLKDGTIIVIPLVGNDNILKENNKIYYTTSDNTKLFPKTDASLYGAILISNTYKDGQGILVFDDSVVSIGPRAFYGCSTLKSITIPNTIEIIGGSAFYGCSSLSSVTLPDNVVEINSMAFYNCTSLEAVYCKPETPPTGGQEMFYYAWSTTSMSYPMHCKIYVPRASVEAYKSAEYWKGYASDIEGCDFE